MKRGLVVCWPASLQSPVVQAHHFSITSGRYIALNHFILVTRLCLKREQARRQNLETRWRRANGRAAAHRAAQCRACRGGGTVSKPDSQQRHLVAKTVDIFSGRADQRRRRPQTLIDTQKQAAPLCGERGCKGDCCFSEVSVSREEGRKKNQNNFQYKHVAVRDIRGRERGLHYVCLASPQESTRVKGYFPPSDWLHKGADTRCEAQKQPAASENTGNLIWWLWFAYGLIMKYLSPKRSPLLWPWAWSTTLSQCLHWDK